MRAKQQGYYREEISWIEIQNHAGHPVPRYVLEDCNELFGDTVDRTVTWKNSSDVSTLANRPVRLRFKLNDADLYSYCFQS